MKKILFLTLLVIALFFATQGQTLAQATPQLRVAYRDTQLPVADPTAAVWNELPAQTITLAPQKTVRPALIDATIPEVTFKAIHNGQWLSVLLTWDDKTRDVFATKPDEFSDGVAVQFPVKETSADSCMGALNQMVNIWHWKGAWQEDVDKGFHDVTDAYPNFWADYYPFVSGKPPFTIKDFKGADARAYLVAWNLGNPVSDPERIVPIEELNAIGNGTANGQGSQDVIGRGVWKDGKWSVVFSRPLITPDTNDAQLTAGKTTSVAFAVWNGSNKEVAARKQTSTWQVVELESTGITVSPAIAGGTVAGVGVIAAVLAVIVTAFVLRRRTK